MPRRIGFGALSFLLLCGCRSPRNAESRPGSVLAVAGEAMRELGIPAPADADTKARIGEIVTRARTAIAGGAGEDALPPLHRLIFDDLGFEREVSDDDIRFSLLPHVIAHRRGSCLGLAGLYLVIADELGLPLRPVLVPNHLFLRHGKNHNVELLRRGERMPDEWYRTTWRVPPGVDAYMRPLTWKEFLAVLRFNLGNAQRERERYEDAERTYLKVVRDFPGFPEAHANLGLVRQLTGKLDLAEKAYLRARELHPGLPGLDRNLAALHLALEKARKANEVTEGR